MLLWGDKGANFVFRVITSDRKHFSNTDPLCIAPAQVCVWGGGGGGGDKNWASSFRVILGFRYRCSLNQQMQGSW